MKPRTKKYHCRQCGKLLPASARFFCPTTDRKNCWQTFLETYVSPYYPVSASSFLKEEPKRRHHRHPLCVSCPRKCKVWAPDGETPTLLVCPQTLPGFDELAKGLTS